MLAPYKEPIPEHPCGQMMATRAELGDAIRLTRSLGVQLAVHAIGDGAVRMVLDGWEKEGIEGSMDLGIKASIPGSQDPSVPSLRIEHCELIDAADVGRFAKMGVACSVQPCHLLADVPVLMRQLPHRLDRVLPLPS